MALTYRNLPRDHVVVVPEPADILAAAEAEAERLFRKGTKRDRLDAELLVDRAQRRARAQRQTLAKMDESRKWERCAPPPPAAALPPPPPEPEAPPTPVPAVKAAKATKAAEPTEA